MFNLQNPYGPAMGAFPMPQGGNPGITPPMGPMGPGGPMAPGMAQPMGMGGAVPGAGPMGPPVAAQGMGPPAGGVVGPNQLDPAAVQQILALQAQQGRRNQVQRSVDLASQLRADASGQLQGRRVGLANVGASALGSYAAKREMDKANVTDRELDTERVDAARKYMGLIQGLRGGGGVM